MNSSDVSSLSRRSSSLAPVPPSRSSATSIATRISIPYKTYAWAPLSKSQAAIDPAIDKAIRDAVEKNLSADDLTKVAGKKPDIYVIYHVTTDRERVRAITRLGIRTAIGREVASTQAGRAIQ